MSDVVSCPTPKSRLRRRTSLYRGIPVSATGNALGSRFPGSIDLDSRALEISAFSPWSGTVQLVCGTLVACSEDLLLFLCRNRTGHYALDSMVLSVVLHSQLPVRIRDAL